MSRTIYQATLLNQTALTGTPARKWLFNGDNTGAPQFFAVDLRDASSASIFISTVGGVTGTVCTFETSTDPNGLIGYGAAAYRLPGGGAYAATALTVGPGVARSVFLDPTDNICWIRLNVTTNDGTPLVVLTFED